ncbi:13193_t:CDS:2, partial [Cetraspora pellucida]
SQDSNARKSDQDQLKNLAECKTLYDELLQINEEAYISQKPLTEEEKHEEQEFFKIDPEAGSGSRTQAYCKGRLTELEELVTQQTTLLNNTELQPVQELLNHKDRFLDLDIETAKDMFKVDGAKYAFSTWFTEAKEIDLVSVILGAENEDEAMQKKYLQCLYQNYSEEEINEIIKLTVDAYRVSDKRCKAWLEHVKQEIESKKFEAGMTEKDKSQTKIAFKIINKYEPIHESKKADEKYVEGNPNIILIKKMKPEFWVGIDEKFLVREVSKQSEVEKLE